MFPWIELLLIVAAYCIGCLNGGYYLVDLLKNEDIRSLGSGNAGSRNAGRVIGRSGFVLTAAFDLAKGAVIVWLLRQLGFDPLTVVLASLAVIIGHIWPLQLRFRGGKGIATSLGVMLLLDYKIAIVLVLLFLCLFMFYRNFTMSGLSAFIITPFLMPFLGLSALHIAAIIIIDLLVLAAHWENIRPYLRNKE